LSEERTNSGLNGKLSVILSIKFRRIKQILRILNSKPIRQKEMGEYGKVAELRYGRIREAERNIEEL